MPSTSGGRTVTTTTTTAITSCILLSIRLSSSFSMWIIIILIATTFCLPFAELKSISEPSFTTSSQNLNPKTWNQLHHFMTADERRLLLGHRDDKDTLPHYELLHSGHIHHLPYSAGRRKRSPDRATRVRISFHAFDQNFTLHLRPNRHFLAPDFAIQEEEETLQTEASEQIERPWTGDCFFYGHSEQHANSTVAVSLCNGIRGLIETQNETYVINPLTNQLRQRAQLESSSGNAFKPHLILRRSSMQDYDCPHHQSTNPSNQSSSSSDLTSVLLHNSLHTYQSMLQQHRQPQRHPSRWRRSVQDLQLEDELDWPIVSRPAVVETAVFLDEELYRLLVSTFGNSEQSIVTYVLTIMNAVQILFRQRALAAQLHISVVLLDILKTQPKDLLPSDNIDTYLTNFCVWQHNRRQQSSLDTPKWDHALLLSGINMYVVDSEGRKKRHVVGLAPVSGMCNSLNSCTISEGTSFQTVLVAGHEMGHSLGMEHDGPSDANDCDADGHIMSPSLGAGKSSFSRCSSRYLRSFLRTRQASCLFERNASNAGKPTSKHSSIMTITKPHVVELNGSAVIDAGPLSPSVVSPAINSLDNGASNVSSLNWILSEHSNLIGDSGGGGGGGAGVDTAAEDNLTRDEKESAPDLLGSWNGRHRLPGQLYGLREQCALRFGRFASPLPTMKESEICSMVKCKVRLGDKVHLYNAHPALEGSKCGKNKWCREGECVLMDNIDQHLMSNSLDSGRSLSSYIPNIASLESTQQSNPSSAPVDQFPLSVNSINEPQFKQVYQNHPATSSAIMRYNNRPIDTNNRTWNLNSISSFDSTGIRVPIISWSSWSSWSSCHSECMAEAGSRPVGIQMSKRSCNNRPTSVCPPDQLRLKLCNAQQICVDSIRRLQSVQRYIDGICRVAARADSSLLGNGTQYPSADTSNPCFVWCQKKKTGGYLTQGWPLPDGSFCSQKGENKYCYEGQCRSFDCSGNSEHDSRPCPYATVGFTMIQDVIGGLFSTPEETQTWTPISSCRHSCLAESRGVRLVSRDCNSNYCGPEKRESFQLCSNAEEHCVQSEAVGPPFQTTLQTADEYANILCRRYSLQYPSLLGRHGKQLPPRKDNLHASCVVSCADRHFSTVHYQMDSVPDGQFPLGTTCALGLFYGRKAYCINGRCVQFDRFDTPLDDSANDHEYMRRAFVLESMHKNRHRRSIIGLRPVQVVTDIRSEEASWSLRNDSQQLGSDLIDNKRLIHSLDGLQLSNINQGSVLRVTQSSFAANASSHGRWHVENWSPCSVTCGSDGWQTRQVVCILASSENSSIFYLQGDSQKCDLKRKPANKRHCNRLPTCV